MDGATAYEYEQETIRLLMGGDKLPFFNYVPQDFRQRVLALLAMERRAKDICERKLFVKINIACPYCGWRHG